MLRSEFFDVTEERADDSQQGKQTSDMAILSRLTRPGSGNAEAIDRLKALGVDI